MARSHRRSRSPVLIPRPWQCAALLAVPAVALWWGGGTGPWAQGMILLAVGAALCLPGRGGRLPAAGVAAGAALLAWTAGAWLPGGMTRVRQVAPPLVLPDCLAVQPWHALAAWLGLAGALGWLVLLWRLRMEDGMRHRMVRGWVWVTGAAGLAAWAAWAAGLDLPGWPGEGVVGPFPNRNQFATVLATGGVGACALVVQDWKGHRRLALLWSGCLACQAGAVLVTGSRAGVALFLLGPLLWGVWQARLRERFSGLAWAGLMGSVMLAVFAMAGGPGWQRVEGWWRGEPRGGAVAEEDARLLIFRDAVRMVDDSPVRGHGLGHFKALSGLYRESFLEPKSLAHPESDWLWLAAEGGLPAVLLVAVMIVVLARPAFPMEPGSDRHVRSACLVAGAVFVLHSLVDVPGHRWGSLLPGLMFLAMARRRDEWLAAEGRGQAVWVRVLGVVLVAGGVGAILAESGVWRAPGPWAERREWEACRVALAGREGVALGAAAGRGVAAAPLQAGFYYYRSAGGMMTGAAREERVADEQRALALDPLNEQMMALMGVSWYAKEPGRARELWERALRLPSAHSRGVALGVMGKAFKDDPWRGALLLQWMRQSPDLVPWWAQILPAEARGEYVLLVLERPPEAWSWGAEQWKHFFHVWRAEYREGAGALLEEHPEWRGKAWPLWGRHLAGQGRHEEACRWWMEHFPPAPEAPGGVASWRVLAMKAPGDAGVAAALARALLQGGQPRVALETLGGFAGEPTAEMDRVQGEALAAAGRWEEAAAPLARYADSCAP